MNNKSVLRGMMISFMTLFLIILGCSSNRSMTIDLGDGIKMEMVLINEGTFTMGSDYDMGEEDESPLRNITITKPFYIGKYEVTQEQWKQIMGTNPSQYKGPKNPVDTVSWNDCRIFLEKLSTKTGRQFGLPTEAQWEYSCRAGTTTKWSFGKTDDKAGEYAWFRDNSQNKTHPAGGKKPNMWGLYDMHGNLGEWCSDFYINPYSHKDLIDPKGPETGDSRVIRGGAWGDSPDNIRSAYRNCNGPDGANDGIGFRCIMLE